MFVGINFFDFSHFANNLFSLNSNNIGPNKLNSVYITFAICNNANNECMLLFKKNSYIQRFSGQLSGHENVISIKL